MVRGREYDGDVRMFDTRTVLVRRRAIEERERLHVFYTGISAIDHLIK